MSLVCLSNNSEMDSVVSVTAVDSGLRALQFLGLDEEDKSSSVGFDVSSTSSV